MGFVVSDGALSAQYFYLVRLRLDQHTIPASLFEMPGLRAVGRMEGTDLNKKARSFAEKLPHEMLLPLLLACDHDRSSVVHRHAPRRSATFCRLRAVTL